MDPHWLWPEAGENLLELQHNFRSVRSKENGHPRQTHQQCARSCGTGLTPDAQIAFSRVKLRLAWRRTVALPRFTGNRQSVDVKQSKQVYGLRFPSSSLSTQRYGGAFTAPLSPGAVIATAPASAITALSHFYLWGTKCLKLKEN